MTLDTLPDYVRGLLDPAAYPEPPDEVRLVQTHISYVLLAGDVVYKTKKPVDFGFIEQMSMERRRAFCEAEVRLNARLAPDVAWYCAFMVGVRILAGVALGAAVLAHKPSVGRVLLLGNRGDGTFPAAGRSDLGGRPRPLAGKDTGSELQGADRFRGVSERGASAP